MTVAKSQMSPQLLNDNLPPEPELEPPAGEVLDDGTPLAEEAFDDNPEVQGLQADDQIEEAPAGEDAAEELPPENAPPAGAPAQEQYLRTLQDGMSQMQQQMGQLAGAMNYLMQHQQQPTPPHAAGPMDAAAPAPPLPQLFDETTPAQYGQMLTQHLQRQLAPQLQHMQTTYQNVVQNVVGEAGQRMMTILEFVLGKNNNEMVVVRDALQLAANSRMNLPDAIRAAQGNRALAENQKLRHTQQRDAKHRQKIQQRAQARPQPRPGQRQRAGVMNLEEALNIVDQRLGPVLDRQQD